MVLIEKRLREAFKGIEFKTHGVPQDLDGARNLAARGREDKNYCFEFEKRALSLINAQAGIRDLRGAIEREGAAIGVFLTLTEPSRPMITEAAGAGQYTLPGTDLSVPRIQIVTTEQAMELRDRAVRVPLVQASHKRAAREEDGGKQGLWTSDAALRPSGKRKGRGDLHPSALRIPTGCGLRQSEVHGGFAAVAVGFDVVGHSLAVVQLADAGTLKRADVDEHVLGTTCRGDEAETFGGVEPFHGALGHRDVSCSGMPSASCDGLA